MSDFFWLQPHVQDWSALLRKNKKPHAVLIDGIEGVGKLILAQQLSSVMLCSISNSEPCGNCSNCHFSQSGHHPDVLSIDTQESQIKVAEIRQLTHFFSSTPHCSQHKIAHINAAEKMNKSAANALLKILEEPPATACLFLMTHKFQSLLPTIRSRCVRITVDTHRQEHEVTQWLTSKTAANDGLVEQALYLSDYAPLAAQQLIQENAIDQFAGMLENIKVVLSGKQSVLDVTKHWIQSELLGYLPYIQKAIMYQFCHSVSPNQGFFGNYSLFQYMQDKEFSLNDVYVLAQKLNSLIIDLQTQLKKELLIESFLLSFKQMTIEKRSSTWQ